MTRKKSNGWPECKRTQCAPGCKWLRPLPLIRQTLSFKSPLGNDDLLTRVTQPTPVHGPHLPQAPTSEGTYGTNSSNSYFWPYGIGYHYYVWLKYVTSILDEEEAEVASSGCLSIRTVLEDLMLN